MQVQLPHRHGGMSLQRFSEDVATAARLSAAVAHAALAGGSDKALPFRGAMGLEAHSSLARLQEAWPTVKGVADSPNNAAERAGRNPDVKALRMAALQRAISHADADGRTVALSATLEPDAKEASSQARSTALADLARSRCCAGSLASAWLTARWSSRAHGSRVLHQCIPAPRQRSLRRSRRRRCVCLRPIHGSRWHPLPHMWCAVAHSGGSP